MFFDIILKNIIDREKVKKQKCSTRKGLQKVNRAEIAGLTLMGVISHFLWNQNLVRYIHVFKNLLLMNKWSDDFQIVRARLLSKYPQNLRIKIKSVDEQSTKGFLFLRWPLRPLGPLVNILAGWVEPIWLLLPCVCGTPWGQGYWRTDLIWDRKN